MRGVGGPLLCIGDLLSDVDDANSVTGDSQPRSPLLSPVSDSQHVDPSHLIRLFQEHYDQLNKALSGTDHSWTSLTLKLCAALETADNLTQSINCHVDLLSEKAEELQRVINRRDSAMKAVKAIQGLPEHS